MQLFSEHVRATTQADATVADTAVVTVVEGNLIDLDSAETEAPTNNRHSFSGSNNNPSRRMSMNLTFTTDHKLRISNADIVTGGSTA